MRRNRTFRGPAIHELPPWPKPEQNPEDLQLAARYAPILLMDDHEPFAPEVAGYRVFRAASRSPSFPRGIRLDQGGIQAAFAIEYAVWGDWGMEPVCERVYVWGYVDAGGRAVRAEASWYGRWEVLRLGLPGGEGLEGAHPVVYVKQGKHELGDHPAEFELVRDY